MEEHCLEDKKNTTKNAGPPTSGVTKSVSNGPTAHANQVKREITKKSDQNTEWRNILLDYTQETSFHGLKQIVKPQPFILRR